MSLPAGTRIGGYEILSVLGAGGMGEVYRARDTRLKRDVALKVLPDFLASDPERLARFEREAELLAALNHTHIAQIYGVAEGERVTALVLELVEGSTLADRLARGPMPVGEALAVATQICLALEAAHDRGIIHRDLKPANIKLTPEGVVKVLDFGLAKAADRASGRSGSDPAGDVLAGQALSNSPTISAIGTRAGVILGTAAYMSPEQARGLAVDRRTDVWAFGCVLYELLTGEHAFDGPTVTDILSSIVSREPDWTRLPPHTPPAIRRLLTRVLQKDPKRRLRDIGDVRLEIEEAESAADVRAPAGGRRSLFVAWTAAALATMAAVAIWWMRSDRAATDPLANSSLVPLTFDAGLTTMPTLSHDGRLLAYSSDRAGRGDLDIWVQLADGTPLRRTDDPADDTTPEFSPDGNQIVFRSERAGGGIYIMPTLGGEPRLLAREGRRPRFSPDGTRIAYWTGLFRGGGTAESSTWIISLAGGTPTRYLTSFATARDPEWSPDGSALLVAGIPNQGGGVAALDWWWVPLDGRSPIKTDAATIPAIRRGLGVRGSTVWTRRGLVFSDGQDIWRVPLALESGRVAGAVERLTRGAVPHEFPTVSDGGAMAFAATTVRRVIERVAIGGLPTPTASRLYEDAQGEGGRASQTRDGSLVVFERDLPGAREVWMKDIRQGKESLVVRLPGAERLVNATVSPDGSFVAYTVNDNGFIVETSGGVPRQLCDGCELHGFLSDSRRVLATAGSGKVGPIRVFAVASSAIHEVIVGSERLQRPHASPNDRWLAFTRGSEQQQKTFLAPLTPGRPPAPETWSRVEEPTVSGRPCGWSEDSRTLYLLLDTDGFRCLWGQRIDDSGKFVGTPIAVRHFHGYNDSTYGTSFGDAITRDGFLYEGQRRMANLWMLPAPAQ